MLYDSYASGGRTYFYWVQNNGKYRAFCMHDRIVYNILANDYETMIFLIDHATHASEIIPAASTDEIIALLSPEEYDRPDNYAAIYASTAALITGENVNLLGIDDSVEGLGDFSVSVKHRTPTNSNSPEWTIYWEGPADRWSLRISFLSENQEFRRAEYESTPKYTEPYTVNGRTFYIIKVPIEPIDQPSGESRDYLVNYFEGNLIYSINVTGRETLELLVSSLVMTEDLIAK